MFLSQPPRFCRLLICIFRNRHPIKIQLTHGNKRSRKEECDKKIYALWVHWLRYRGRRLFAIGFFLMVLCLEAIDGPMSATCGRPPTLAQVSRSLIQSWLRCSYAANVILIVLIFVASAIFFLFPFDCINIVDVNAAKTVNLTNYQTCFLLFLWLPRNELRTLLRPHSGPWIIINLFRLSDVHVSDPSKKFSMKNCRLIFIREASHSLSFHSWSPINSYAELSHWDEWQTVNESWQEINLRERSA